MTGFTVHFISFVSTIKVNITKQKVNWSIVCFPSLRLVNMIDQRVFHLC